MSPALDAPREEYVGSSALLALAVHVGLAAALVLGVHWQSRAPDVVMVELWQAPAPPAPRPEPVRAEPPPPPPKPEPRIEKPDIAVKAAPKPKPKPKPEPKPAPKPKPVAKPAPKPDDTQAQQLLAQALQREQQQFAAERESQAIREQLERDAAAARSRALQTWVDKIKRKIRGNIVLPPDIQGNPEALVLVSLLPTGEVLGEPKLVISSGHARYDDAVMRAIRKSSPLPKPDSQALFTRDLKLTFRPQD